MRRCVSIALCAAWVAAAVHAAEPHVYCEEHQALEEEPARPRHAAPYPALCDAGAGARHEACSVVGQIPEDAPAVAPVAVSAVAAPTPRATPVTAARPIPLLALAPKTSPPRG